MGTQVVVMQGSLQGIEAGCLGRTVGKAATFSAPKYQLLYSSGFFISTLALQHTVPCSGNLNCQQLVYALLFSFILLAEQGKKGSNGAAGFGSLPQSLGGRHQDIAPSQRRSSRLHL